MKDFVRSNMLLSLCGLNCGLCPINLAGHCPGCGGGLGNQPCPIARCSLSHEGVEYCFQCQSFPCELYRDGMTYDSFITYQNRLKDLYRAEALGIETYNRIQVEKRQLLRHWLDDWNDGRHKTLYTVAVNVLELDALHEVNAIADEKGRALGNDLKVRAAFLSDLLQEKARAQNLTLTLRKKPPVGKSSAKERS